MEFSAVDSAGRVWAEFPTLFPNQSSRDIQIRGTFEAPDRENFSKIFRTIHIEEVDGAPTQQSISGTPKFNYPGGVASPRALEDILRAMETLGTPRVFEKLDGTNVLFYRYQDAAGNIRITARSRRTPVFYPDPEEGVTTGYPCWWALIHDALAAFSAEERFCFRDVMDVVYGGQYAAAFELYGIRNEILVQYENIPIAMKLIYLVNQTTGDVVLPLNASFPPQWSVLLPAEITFEGYGDLCQQIRDTLEFEEVEALDEDNHPIMVRTLIRAGAEGYMMYFPGGEVFKCKPEEIVEFQSSSPAPIDPNNLWVAVAAGAQIEISEEDVWTTAHNTLSEMPLPATVDELIENTLDLLSETYSPQQIAHNMGKIRKKAVEFYAQCQLVREIAIWLDQHGYDRIGMKELMSHPDFVSRRKESSAIHGALKRMGRLDQ